MRLLIYGAGGVGQALGCLLAAHGCRVDLLLRERFAKVIREQGLGVTGIFGDFFALADGLGVYTDFAEVQQRPYDYVIVTTKSYDTERAVADISRLARQSFTAVSMQNGCGNLEKLIDVFGIRRSLGARVITGFAIERPGLVRITVTADAIHIGALAAGDINEKAEVLAETINRAGLPCEVTPHIKKDLYAKLLYNCALNPLGAILGVHYGALGDHRETRRIMDLVIDEVFAVLTAMDEETLWKKPEEYRKVFYTSLLPATYHHRPSMLQDLENGKKTEIDAITGYVATMGRKHHIPTPVCDLLSGLVRFKENHR
jgi:2-dehydropantoate 2-reductase